MSMPSKLTALYEDLALQSPLSSGTEETDAAHCNDFTVLLELPPPQTLNNLLRIYFVEHNLFLPCVDQKRFEVKLLKTLLEKGYGRNCQAVKFSVGERSFGALLCVILALAEFINPQEPFSEGDLLLSTDTGWSSWHQQALLMLEPAHLVKRQGLDTIRFHLLEAMHLINKERLAESSRTLVTGIDLAMRMGLNRQKTWETSDDSQNLERRTLWWALYYMDRKIAEKCSRPCFIRDTDVDVKDFSSVDASSTKPVGARTLTSRSWDLAYLQTLVEWARLWGKMWDAFFAAQASGLGNVDELEAMDARIQCVGRRLPSEVKWDTSLFQLSSQSPEEELQSRAQLLTLIRFNLLRLNLRLNPLTKPSHDQYSISFCGSLAIDTVNAVVTYLNKFPNVGQLGFFVTVALVECVCQLIPSIVMGVSQPNLDAAIRAVHDSQRILHVVSLRHGAATRAAIALSQVFSIIGAWQNHTSPLNGQDLQFGTGSDTMTPSLFEFLCNGPGWNLESAQLPGMELDSSILKTFLQDSFPEIPQTRSDSQS
ncbi:hypothetical protein LTS15_004616 [Exophiala xenobiotica]|nr:hypothetical protein LTS15_004616 [Exophiala xenobiotica]